MSDYFFGRFADLVDPITKKNEFEKVSGTSEILNNNSTVRQKRVEEVKSNFLNKYIYSAVINFNSTLSCNFLFCFTLNSN